MSDHWRKPGALKHVVSAGIVFLLQGGGPSRLLLGLWKDNVVRMARCFSLQLYCRAERETQQGFCADAYLEFARSGGSCGAGGRAGRGAD
jgi:hypothetical protein